MAPKVSCVLCLECGTLLFSTYRHDCRTCICPNQATNDGGSDYQRYGAINMDKIAAGTFITQSNEFMEGIFDPTPVPTTSRWPY